MFRSVDMSYVQVVLPSACAEEFVDRVAREGCIQFTDLNESVQPFQRQYTHDIITIQEIERQIKAIEELLIEYNIRFSSQIDNQYLQSKQRNTNAQIIETISKEVVETYKRLIEQSVAERQLSAELLAQQNSIRVLNQLDNFLQFQNEVQTHLTEQRRQQQQDQLAQQNQYNSGPSQAVPLLEMQQKEQGAGILMFSDKDASRDVGFRYFSGVVSIAQRVAFERQIFLTSRGNSFVKFDENEILANGADKPNIPFVVFFLGDQLQRSLKRLCQFMNIQICYESDSGRSREDLLKEANSKCNDFTRIHLATTNQLHREMKETARCLSNWKISLIQEKAIRITLNKFQTSNNVLVAKGWCPSTKRDVIQTILDEVTTNKNVGVRAILTEQRPKGIVPTHFDLTDLSGTFQVIVNTYGVPRYKEFNPAIPTIVTFPFLFGVMYGDVFHGSFLFLFGCCLVFGSSFYKDSRSSALQSLHSARFVFFFMGFFALYCGLIYNDCMSIMINGWNHAQWAKAQTTEGTTVLVQKNNVYAFGVDPTWGGVSNQLTFENSLKMKLSIILGVTQMTFGLFLKLSNHIQEGDMISIFCEFIPQSIFMLSFFGYMVFLIVFKWCLSWGTLTNLSYTPSLITVLIKMILSPGGLDDTTTLYDANLQKRVQVICLLLMGVSVPWMLIPKPLLLKRKHEQKMATLHHHLQNKNDIELEHKGTGSNSEHKHDDDDDEEHEEFEMGEIVIHQLIHTIEYVLGTVSNTASYLRLWALSLAHSQLSEVFYEKTIQSSLGGTGPMYVIESVITCFMFLMFTLGVLLLMDVLECFLHALRLHWVEFQNKFFYADGVAFEAFSYSSILKED